MRPISQSVGLLISLYLLLLWRPLQCHAGDSSFKFNGGKLEDGETPPNFADGHDSSAFTEEADFSFNGDQVPVNIHPISGNHVLSESFFKPTLTMDLHYVQFEDEKRPVLIQASLEHEEHPYVNLESIESFLAEPVTCRMARADEDTDLDLHFATDHGFEMARKYWRSENATIRFIVEGLHCFEAAGFRSVYHANKIRFDADRKVVIQAEPLHAQLQAGSGWAHSIRLRSIDQPAEHRIAMRRSLSITHDLATLRKRGFDIHFDIKHDGMKVDLSHKFSYGEDWGPRKQFFERPSWYNGPFLNLTCLDCHARGAWHASFDVRINVSPFKNRKGCKNRKPPHRKRSEAGTAFHEKHESAQPFIYAHMESNRIQRHRFYDEKVRELRKRGETHHPVLEDLTCTREDPTFPICHDQQLPRALHDTLAAEIDPCNQFLRPIRAIGKTGYCFLKTMFGHGHACGKQWAADLKDVFDGGLKEYMKELIRTHLEEMEVRLEVEETIDVKFQLEISGVLGMSFWFDVDLATTEFLVCPDPAGAIPWVCPNPKPPIAPSFGWFLSIYGGSPTGTSLGSLPVSHEKDKDGNDKWVSTADKMTPAMDSWTQKKREYNKDGDLDAAKSEKGSVTFDPAAWNQFPLPTLDLFPMRYALSVSIDMAFNATLPGFRVQIPAGGFMIWNPLLEKEADRFQSSITMKTEYLEAQLELASPKFHIRMSLGPAFKFKLIPVPQNMKVGYGLTGISDPLAMGAHFQPIRMDHIFSLVGPSDPDGCSEAGVKYEMVIRTGLDAYVMVFFQRVVDLSWIGTLQKSNIASEMVRGLWFSKRLIVKCLNLGVGMDQINKHINAWLSKIQAPIKEEVAEIGEFVNSHANRPVGFEQGVPSWRPNNTDRGLIDLLEWSRFVTKSEPGMKFKNCDASHVELGCNTSDPYLVADMTGDCPEEGMCDPWSAFYIPSGVTEAIQKTYDIWLNSIGMNGTFNNHKDVSAMDMYNESLHHNSSTLVAASSTFVMPIPMASDPSILSEWQDGLNHDSITETSAPPTTNLPAISSTTLNPSILSEWRDAFNDITSTRSFATATPT